MTTRHDPAVLYRVQITRPVTVLGLRLLPLHEHTLTGALLDALVDQEGDDVVHSAEPV